ncbi:MAG: CAP domain-containing protein [Nitrososphaeria archaeon]
MPDTAGETMESTRNKTGGQNVNWRIQLTPVIVGLIVLAVFFFYVNPQLQSMRQTKYMTEQTTITQSQTSTLTSASIVTVTSTVTQTATTWTTASTTSAPETYVNRTELVLHVLELINDDRADFKLSPVMLGNNSAAQRHADDLLKLDCLSHWGSNGMKPYMRYTILGGKNYVEENVAAVFIFNNSTTPSTEEIKLMFEDLEYRMMYNDSASNWGHRNNILDPSHTHVNIGVSYSYHAVIVVQDFENVLVDWQIFDARNTKVTLKGRLLANLQPYLILVYYDPLPEPLTADQLRQPPYNSGYSMGDKLGAILNRGYEVSIPYIYATKWSRLGANFEVSFDFSKFVQKEGVYTIVLEVVDGSGHLSFATSHSIFIEST